MRCRIPDLHNKISTPDNTNYIYGRLAIMFDGDSFFWTHSRIGNNTFIVYPDPEFEKLDKTSTKIIEWEQKLLELKVKITSDTVIFLVPNIFPFLNTGKRPIIAEILRFSW